MANELERLEEQYEPATVLEAETFIQPPLPDVSNYDLTPLQLKAAQAVMINDMTLKKKGAKRKPYKQIAVELGIDEDTLIKYRALPEFQRFVKDAVSMSAASSIPMAITRLHQLADGSITGTPSIRAIEMILEIGGVYSKSQNHNINVQQAQPIQTVSDADIQRIIAQQGDIIEGQTDESDEDKTK